jgi:hypothetical protein
MGCGVERRVAVDLRLATDTWTRHTPSPSQRQPGAETISRAWRVRAGQGLA